VNQVISFKMIFPEMLWNRSNIQVKLKLGRLRGNIEELNLGIRYDVHIY
jgi:hypothetical protein